MELRQLRYFAKAAETLNFSDAAKCLNIAQSSLSQQIKQLEDELGIQLFIRNYHSIRLTEAGEAMLPFALRSSSYSCQSLVLSMDRTARGAPCQWSLGYKKSSTFTGRRQKEYNTCQAPFQSKRHKLRFYGPNCMAAGGGM